MAVTYAFAKELKALTMDKFGVYLHFHDACSGQYFDLEESDLEGAEPEKLAEILKAIEDYCESVGRKAYTKEGSLIFTVEGSGWNNN